MDNFNPIQYILHLLGGLAPAASKPTHLIGDPSQMKLTYGNSNLLGANPAAAQTPQPVTNPTTATVPPQQNPTPQATPIAMPQQQLAQNIANTWGKDTPLLNNLPDYMQAGNNLSGNMEKLLPIALALRETQGGKYNVGKNNVGNLRNDTGQFQDYPDLKTALSGNLNQGGQSGGMVGLLNGDKSTSKDIYADFRKSNNYADLFKHWSPQSDNNGDMNTQVNNINWILNKLKQGG